MLTSATNLRQRARESTRRLPDTASASKHSTLSESCRLKQIWPRHARTATVGGASFGGPSKANEILDEVVFDDQRPLADAYEVSVSAADEVADRLRREAERVAQKAEL